MLFLGRFFISARRSLTYIFALSFFLGGLSCRLSPFPLLVTAVVKLLIGRLFLHPSIMS